MKKKKSVLSHLFIWLTSLAAIGLIPAAILFNNLQMAMAEDAANEYQTEAQPANDQTTEDIAEAEPSPLASLAPLVSVIPTQAQSYPAMIQVFGEATARHELALSSLVSGQATWIAPQFESGQSIIAGTPLVKVSKRDYLPALATAKQELATAKQALSSTDQSIAVAYENVANAEQALASAYQEQAAAQLALKQELQQARLAQQSFDKTDKVASAQSEVTAAVLALKQEKSQQQLAKQDWKLAGIKGAPSELASRQPQIAAANARLHAAKLALQRAQYDFKQKNTELEQRKPQIAEAKARVNAARARIKSAQQQLISAKKQITATKQQIQVNEARINAAQHQVTKAKDDLAQTVIKAPFNAVVTSRSIAQGSYINVGQSLGQLQSSDEVEITLALSEQQWALLPTSKQTKVKLTDSNRPHISWQGKIVRMAQFINQQTRTRDIIVRVAKPLEQAQPLLVGTFLQASIQGKTTEHALKIPSSALAADGFIWFVDQGDELQRMNAHILFAQGDDLFIPAPEQTQALNIVRWPLASYLPGMKVKPQADPQQQAQVSNQGGAS